MMRIDQVKFAEFKPGEVWLVGAGPGDAALLTLSAVHALSNADVIVYDALVGDGIIKLANKNALLVFAGKRGGKASAKQSDITRSIIEFAEAKKRVLRLKGGDPFMFGRGGEEAMALTRANITFRIVPGITAGIGGLALAGIPATHRDTNTVLVLMSGHDARGAMPSNVDWEALARMPTIVLYMALRNLGEIAIKLIAAGRAGEERLALISRASLPEQLVVETTLERAEIDAVQSGIKPPVVVVIGKNVDLRSKILPNGEETHEQLLD